MTSSGPLSTCAAVLCALADGAAVGAWIAAGEHDGNVPRRRRLRRRLTAGFAAQAMLVELAWEYAGPTLEAGTIDGRTTRQTLTLAGVATVVLSPLDTWLPRRLAARGVRHPHLAFGVATGLAYAACSLPIWLADRRRRLDRIHAAAAVAHDQAEECDCCSEQVDGSDD